ncbi:MAG: ORF6N domain-containing protein [Bdellovibrionaceae bacterium]|nr:ORF6N domain-containing protein [Pseudobdellovibrionaceae bacterium]
MPSDISSHDIRHRIFFVRDHRVMLDSDLAKLYGVETGALNRAVQRNKVRFPEDFMFQLTEIESESLRCQTGISNDPMHRGGRRYLPLVFTEQGVAMLSGVLRSEKATLVNIEIMRAFVKLRAFLLTNQELARKLNDLEKRYDTRFREVFEAIRSLMSPPEIKRRKIGIRSDQED